jgi:3-oxoacyl-[acyl-carrier protein] reductase
VGTLTGKTALVTGASRGIGRAVALRLARDGALTGVHYGASADAARDLVAEIRQAGGRAFQVGAELGAPGDAGRLWHAFDAGLAEHGGEPGLDILVNNAGIGTSPGLESGVTRIALPEIIAYSMTKGALNTFSLTLAKALGERGITVNSVVPGIVATDNTAPMLATAAARERWASYSAFGRIGQPSDIADVVAFVASDDARWITGQYIDATGGSQL